MPERVVDVIRRFRGLFGQAGEHKPVVVEVEFAKPYRVARTTDVWVLCLSGTAWLTRDGYYSDAILAQGDAKHVSMADDPLVVGMPRCRLRIVVEPEQLAEPNEPQAA